MTAWLAAAGLAALLGALSYAPPPRGVGARAVALAALRAVAALLLAALALDAPAGRAGRAAPLRALDVSASTTRALGPAGAGGLAAPPGGDTLWLVGDSARVGTQGRADRASRVAPIVERAAALGRPLILVTDGELDDADALLRAPTGSRVVRPAFTRGRDAALVAVQAPRAASATDTADVEVRVAADASGSAAGRVTVGVGTRVVEQPVPALAAFAEHVARARVPLAGLAGPVLVRATVASAGDVEARNDTAHAAIEVAAGAAVVFLSTAPDPDARVALAVLRGALALGTRAYLQVAPGQWRAEGSFAPVSEAEVRRAAGAASLLVVHGDTAALGAPRSLGRAALALVAPPPPAAGDAGDWYAASAPASPIQPALATVPWDSLPPLDVGAAAPPGAWTGLLARFGRQGVTRPVITGREEGARRVVVMTAGGTWRWSVRPGAPADAAAALWGGIFDWLAAGRPDERAALPTTPAVRDGDPLRWRRGGEDSVVTLAVARRGAGAAATSLVVRFAAGAREAESPGLPAGVYDVRGPGGGPSLLVVDAPRELLPRRPTVSAGPVGRAAAAGRAPRLRDFGWAYLLPVVLLCAEWLLRRRAGLR